MLKGFFIWTFSAVLAGAASGAGIEIKSDGTLTVDKNSRLSLVHYSDKWTPSTQSNPAVFLPQHAGSSYSGEWKFRDGGSASCAISITPSEGGYTLSYELVPVQPIRTSVLAVQLEFPTWTVSSKTILIGDSKIRFPEKYGKPVITTLKDISRIELGLPNGVLVLTPDNPITASLSDFRQFQPNTLALRLEFPLQDDGKILKSAKLGFRVQFKETVPPPPFELVRNGEWRPYSTDRSVKAGSALDFSFIQDAPAGKYGYVHCKGDHFVFEKTGKPIRFYGANLCYSAQFLSKPEADQLAERLSCIGYNAMRFHHFDRDLIAKGAPDTVTFDPEQFDKLDYLLHAFKQRGIYVTIDLYTDRTMKPGEFQSFPTLRLPKDYKLAAMLLPEVRNNLKAFSRKLLTHVNPYTGFRWADEPAIVGISLLNENTIQHISRQGSKELRDLYDRAFEAWAAEKNVTLTKANREVEYRLFLINLYREYYSDMTAFLKGLGVKAPLTEQNFMSTPNAVEQRLRYDYVDNHAYWDHPMQVAGGTKFGNTSVIRARMNQPKGLSAGRVFGKPYTVTETDYCYPNEYRAEAAPVVGAYAAMQDWGGVYRFAYSHNYKNLFDTVSIDTFDVVNDPIRVLGERIAIAFFTRSDVKTAEQAFPIAVSKDAHLSYRSGMPGAGGDFGMIGRTGSVEYQGNGHFLPGLPEGTKAIYAELTPELKSDDVPYPLTAGSENNAPFQSLVRNKVLPEELFDFKNNRFRSTTGELYFDIPAGFFQVTTPRSEAAVLPEGQTSNGKFLTAHGIKNFSVVAAIAVDGKPLADSSRILLLHLTDDKAEKVRFADATQHILTDRGSSVLMGKKGVAELTFPISGAGWKLYALDFDGSRLAELPLEHANGRRKFAADTFGIDGKVVYAYELVR